MEVTIRRSKNSVQRGSSAPSILNSKGLEKRKNRKKKFSTNMVFSCNPELRGAQGKKKETIFTLQPDKPELKKKNFGKERSQKKKKASLPSHLIKLGKKKKNSGKFMGEGPGFGAPGDAHDAHALAP